MSYPFASAHTWLLAGFLCLFSLSCKDESIDSEEWTLSSPDGKILMTIAHQERAGGAPALRYRVDLRGTGGVLSEALGWSPLGIAREDADFSRKLVFTGTREQEVEERYEMLRGKRRQIHSRGMERRVSFRGPDGEAMELIARAYNDGVAFRYAFPEQSDTPRRMRAEYSGFQLPAGRAWLQPYDSISKWSPAYERYYQDAVPVGAAAPGPEGWCFPALFRGEAHWVLLSEADLDSRYCGAHLAPEAPNGLYTLRFPEADEAMGAGETRAASTLPWQTPWRVAIIGKELGDIVEFTLITNLSPPSLVSNPSWIRPGRVSWSWWSDHPSSKDFNKLKRFIDLAAAMGWEYSLVDANWNLMKGGDIEQLLSHAAAKGVGLWLWYNSGGAHNTVEEEPRDRMWNADARRAEMARLQRWGVKGIKVDFFQSDKQHIIAQYLDILRDAAEFQLMVNFHGCTIPRGWERTYPHLLTMEAVKGAEAYSFDQSYPVNAPAQNTIFAATRNVIGPMDYTPVTFSDNTYPHITTNPHELALGVIFESGAQHLADRVEAYFEAPEAVRNFLRDLPVAWDETRFVRGEPGKEFIIARRRGDIWYVAGINGEAKNKEWRLDLSFTGKANAIPGLLIGDDANPRGFAIRAMDVHPEFGLPVKLRACGGFVLRLGEKGF